MIQKTELRIGNWIYSDRCGNAQISSLADFSLTADEDFNSWGLTYDLLKAIPLTPEILEKCGFEKEYYAYTIGSFEVEYAHGKFYPCINIAEYRLGIELKYLHQLQNLYFAFTGKELEIQLDESKIRKV